VSPTARVLGAGIYGCMAALELAAAGFSVDLFERRQDILLGATQANQGRLHLGYHYPRSPATVAQPLSGNCRAATSSAEGSPANGPNGPRS